MGKMIGFITIILLIKFFGYLSFKKGTKKNIKKGLQLALQSKFF